MNLTTEQLVEAIRLSMLYQYNVSAWDIYKEVYGTGHVQKYAEEKVELIVEEGILGLSARLDSGNKENLANAILKRYRKGR